MKITVANPPVDQLESTYLSAATQAGATTLLVNNNNKFTGICGVMIGQMGRERTEIVTTSGITGNTSITVSAAKFGHDADDPVYALKYDTLRTYRSTTGISGSYSFLNAQTLDVDNSSLETVYDDTSGLTSYYYKASFYDSVNAIESSLSDPIAGTGYPRGTAGALINEIFDELNDVTQQYMSVTEAVGLLNEVNDDIISQSRRPYRFLKTSALLNTTLDTARISLPTDLAKFERLLYTNAFDERTDSYRRISMDEMEYVNFDNTEESSDDLIYVSIDESTNEIVLFPAPATTATGSIKIFYWRKFNEITGLASILETPNPRIYKLFLLGRYYRKRAAKEPNYLQLSDRYLSDYNTEIVKLQRSNRLDMGTPMSFKPDTRNSRGLRRI